MPRRAQLALALVLLLVLAPLAGASCGIQCLAPTPHRTPSAITHHDCQRAVTCCHSSGAAICSATQPAGGNAALLSAETNTPGVTALAALAASSLPVSTRTLASRRANSASPGQFRTASLIPIRV